MKLWRGTLGMLKLELDLSTHEDVHESVRPVDSLGSAWDGRVLLCSRGDAVSGAVCPGEHNSYSVAKSPNCWDT